jgi:hypothetical protein
LRLATAAPAAARAASAAAIRTNRFICVLS